MYGSVRWKKLRRRVLVESGFRCSECYASVSGKGQSRVDHIVPVKVDPSKAWDISNLRVLCVSCDNKRHSEKGYGVNEHYTEIQPNGEPVGGWN